MLHLAQSLSISEICEESCRLCRTLGCLRPENLTWATFLHELDAIEFASPHEIVLPPNALLHSDIGSFCAEITRRGLRPIVRVRPARFLSDAVLIASLDYQGAFFEVLVDQPVTSREFDVIETFFRQRPARLVVVPSERLDASAVLDALPPALVAHTRVLAPIASEGFLTPDEMHEWIERNSQHCVLQTAGLDQGASRFWETGVRAESVFVRGWSAPTARVSVVIPFRDRVDLLLKLLGSLEVQTLERTRFEIIVVADRVSESVLLQLTNELGARKSETSIRVFRLLDTGGASDEFRAGIVRNAGAFRAFGDVLVFLDADALVPPRLLSDALEAHEKADVIQYRRAEADPRTPSHPDWDEFYRADAWSLLADQWKYVSSFALSIKLRHFLAVGGFPSALTTYGCEDTFLGWKLNRLGARFELRKIEVTHQGSAKRTALLSARRKMKLMSESARAFYLCTLDRDVYRVFFSVLGPAADVRGLARAAARRKGSAPVLSVVHFILKSLVVRDRASFIRESVMQWRLRAIEFIEAGIARLKKGFHDA